jgi:hypothetical protein
LFNFVEGGVWIATRTWDHLTDLLDFFISEIVKVGKSIALVTGGFPRSGNGRERLNWADVVASVRLIVFHRIIL